MFMSLFFLKLSLLTYFLGHYWAKKTQPNKHLSFSHSHFFTGNTQDFKKVLQKWLTNNSRLELVKESQELYVLSEKPGLLSYGYFYHITTEEMGEKLKVNISVQAKLVSSPIDKNHFSKQLADDLELDNAG